MNIYKQEEERITASKIEELLEEARRYEMGHRHLYIRAPYDSGTVDFATYTNSGTSTTWIYSTASDTVTRS